MADDETVTTDSIEGPRVLWSPTTLVHVGDSGDGEIQGGDEIDIIDLGGGADTAAGGRNFNIILGGSGADILKSEGFWEDVIGGSGDDTITATGVGAWLFGGTGNDTITGSDSNWGPIERLFGGDGDDTIDGGGGRDYIIGGAGDDDLTGGGGADVFFFSEGDGNDTIQDFNAAQGDMIYLRSFDQTITWDQLSTKITTVTDENSVVTGVKIDLSDWGGGTITLNGITDVNDVTADMFYLDTIVGSDGSDDVLQGGTSDDTMTGGTGADTFVFDEDSGNDTITDFSTTEGDKIDLTDFDVAITWAQLQAVMRQVDDDPTTMDVDETATVIDLSSFGGGQITLQGITATDLTEDMFVLHKLQGSDGVSDRIMSKDSDDTMSGGTGADFFVFGEGHGADIITDFSTTEGDKIDLRSFTQEMTWEELRAAMTQVEDDANTMGVDETATVIDLSPWGGGTITLNGITSVSDLTEDMFVLDDFTGGAGDDTIEGGTTDDTLTGGEGADTFVFGLEHGADTITDFTADTDKIDLSALVDITDFSQLTIADNTDGDAVIDLSSHGGGSITLTGVSTSDLDADDFVLYQNVYTGTFRSENLEGGAGDDTITGGGGSDIFVFRDTSGDDTITDFDTANDKIFLRSFSSTVTWDALSDNFTTVTDENSVVIGVKIDLSEFGGGTIILNGITSISDLTEDMFVLDQITGSDGVDDVLRGGNSDDTMTGGTGADTFKFDEMNKGADTITDFSTADDKIDLTGFDAQITWAQLQAVMTQTADDPLTTGVDETATVIDLSSFGGGTITLEGVSLDDLSASDFTFYQDQYTGTANADTLTGGAGADTITGLAGDDTLTGGEGDDTFVFAAGHGDDTITDFTDGEDTIDLSSFTGITAFSDLTVVQNGSNTVITVPGGGTITLQDFTSTDLEETDFTFHGDAQQDGM